MERVSIKTLGFAGVVAAPFLGIEMWVNGGDNNTSWGGLCDLVYMLGWMCSIIGLLRLQAAGSKPEGRWILYIQLALLTIANAWNIWVIFDPGNESSLFFIMDLFWPVSNAFMLVTGITVAIKAQLSGWRRWTALLAGCWLPFTIGMMALAGKEMATPVSIFYSIAAWGLLGFSVATAPETSDDVRAYHAVAGK